ncbi:MAG: hypothetical protein HZA46_04865 [Planctomycetales bacterium]|nr:hypothetical protein [Planctomycetales bacterium]
MSDTVERQLLERRSGSSPVDAQGFSSASLSVETADADRPANELKKKDQLIAALTERLEQAAEQLDRSNRSGEALGAKRSPPIKLTDVLAEHQAVAADLREITESWREFQTDVVLERIEQQVLELRDFVAEKLSPSEHGGGQFRRPSETFRLNDHDTATGTDRAGTVGDSASLPRSNESFRLGAAGNQSGESSSSPTTVPTGENPPSSAESHRPVDLPTPVAFDTLSLDDAIAAICDRDQCILELRERLALQIGSTENSSSPEAIQARLGELDEIWQEKFRQHEMSLSLERARLAREDSELRQKQERLTKELGQYNLAKGGDAGAPSASAKENAKRSRWTRFLGTSKTSGKSGDS